MISGGRKPCDVGGPSYILKQLLSIYLYLRSTLRIRKHLRWSILLRYAPTVYTDHLSPYPPVV